MAQWDNQKLVSQGPVAATFHNFSVRNALAKSDKIKLAYAYFTILSCSDEK